MYMYIYLCVLGCEAILAPDSVSVASGVDAEDAGCCCFLGLEHVSERPNLACRLKPEPYLNGSNEHTNLWHTHSKEIQRIYNVERSQVLQTKCFCTIAIL